MQSNLMISGANFDDAFSKNETESFHSKSYQKICKLSTHDKYFLQFIEVYRCRNKIREETFCI